MNKEQALDLILSLIPKKKLDINFVNLENNEKYSLKDLCDILLDNRKEYDA